MMIRTMALWTLALAAFSAFAEPRILVLGDSWAAGIFHFKAFEAVFEARGVADVEVVGTKTALGGSRADQWAENHQGKLDLIAAELTAHPTVDMVHISIGGNDFLRFGLENDLTAMDPAERAKEWDAICADIAALIRFIQSERPGIRVLLCDYDFVSPETIKSVLNMSFKGEPNSETFNRIHLELALKKRALAASMENVAYVHHYGLMHYHYGLPGAAEPKALPFPGAAPDYEPFPGGDIAHGPSVEAMPDGVHPMPQGYIYIIDNCFEQVYTHWLAAK